MGFENLGAFDLRIRLEFDDGFTLPAFHGHQVPKDLYRNPPTRTPDFSDDPFSDRLHQDLGFHPPAAFTEMIAAQFSKRRPGDLGKHLPVVWAAEFVHPERTKDQGLAIDDGKLGRENSGRKERKLGLKVVYVWFLRGQKAEKGTKVGASNICGMDGQELTG